MNQHLFLLNFLICTISPLVFADSLQNKIDYSVLAEYKENPKSETQVLSAERGYLLTNSKLKEYVSVADEKWNAKVNDVPLTKSSPGSLQDIYKIFSRLKDRALGSPTAEKITEMKKTAETSEIVGQTLKKTLAIYGQGVPMKMIASDICSASGPKMNAYYKNEVFYFSQVQDPTSKSTHTTQIRFKDSTGKEKEDFLQIGSYQLAEYETYTYSIRAGENTALLAGVKTPITMMDYFVKNQVYPHLESSSQITTSEKAALTLDLEKAWHVFKRAAACCAVNECRKVLITPTTQPPSNSSPNKSTHQAPSQPSGRN